MLLFSLPPPLAATVTSTRVARHDLGEDHGGRVVAGVLARELRVGHDAGAQRVVGVVVALAHAFVDGVVQAAGEAFPAHVHADLEEHVDDAGVLADRAVAGGAHLAVGQDLRDRVLGRRALLALVGARQVGDVVGRVVVADVLQGGGDGFNQVGLADGGGHGGLLWVGWVVTGLWRCSALSGLCRPWGLRHQAVGVGNGHGAEQEDHVDDGLVHQHLFFVVGGVDEGLEQVDRRDADDGRGQFDLEHRGVHMAQPLGLVGVALQAHAAHKGLVATHDHHDQQVGDHDHVDQGQHHQHDDGFVRAR